MEVDEGNCENYDTDDEKEREDMFKRHDSKTIKWNPNDPGFDITKFLGETKFYVTKLREIKRVNEVINKIIEDFEKIVTKSTRLKRYVKNILPSYKKWKTHK